jgi:hypothetical protein
MYPLVSKGMKSLILKKLIHHRGTESTVIFMISSHQFQDEIDEGSGKNYENPAIADHDSPIGNFSPLFQFFSVYSVTLWLIDFNKIGSIHSFELFFLFN